jgi:CBS domain containing-hemolysin-like protein
MGLTLLIILISTILILSGLASGSEAALLSVSYAKVKELENSSKKLIKIKAKQLIKIKDDLQKYISTIVILNNIINIVGSIYVGLIATKVLGETYLGIISGILTFLIIIFSEIIPKIYGEKYSKEISLNIATPLIFIASIFSPILFIINKITTTFVKENHENNISEGEIKEMAALGEKEGSVNAYENDVINNVFKMDDIEVYDIMIPKNQVQTIDMTMNFDEIVKLASETGNTRFPVIKEGEIIGLINAKDLFKFYKKKLNSQSKKF